MEPTETTARSIKRWVTYPPAPASLLRKLSHIPPLVVQLLHNRGVTEAEAVGDFLAHRARDDNPFTLAGIQEAVARIRQAIKRGEKIAVYGDFDADGVTATVVLIETLRGLGAHAQPYIPHRVDEGYGLHCDALASLANEGVRLVITVDCGIRAVDEIAFGARQGLDLIVTDHHSLGEELPPAVACINPKRGDSRYTFRELAGVGVAYKVAQALLRVESRSPLGRSVAPPAEEDLLDLVALGTVADLAPLLGENRALVQRGLARLNQGTRAGLQAMLGESRLKPGQVTATDIGFILAPRLNAAGRLDSAMLSYELLTTGEAIDAAKRATTLGQLNRQRQRLTAEALALAETRLLAEGGVGELLFVAEAGLLPGIVGLVAGQLSEAYYRPAIVVELGGEQSRGSARSIPEFHITRALDQCSAQGLLVRHGGHAAAAGFTVETRRLGELRGALQMIACAELAGQELSATLAIDAEVDLQTLDWATLELVGQLEPFGYGNPAPLLASREVELLSAYPVGSDKKHLKLKLWDGRQEWDAIAFRGAGLLDRLSRHVDIAYRLEQNEWNGRVSLQLNVQDIRPA